MMNLIRCAFSMLLLMSHAGEAQNTSELRLLAEQGDFKAQIRLGFMYRHGIRVTQDYVEAAHWYPRFDSY
jgi:TPR repeat protein